MKHFISVGAALAALALTTGTGFAQTSSNVPNSGTPGSPGYSGSATKTTHKPAITKKQNMALNHTGSSSNQPNTEVPGSNGYSGSGKLDPKGSAGTGATLNSMAMKRKSTSNHNTPNSEVPGSASYSGSAPKPGN